MEILIILEFHSIFWKRKRIQKTVPEFKLKSIHFIFPTRIIILYNSRVLELKIE